MRISDWSSDVCSSDRVARIVDDAAKLGISGRWHQRGRGQRQDRGTGGDQVAEIGGIHGITPSLLGDGLLAGEKTEARSMSAAQSSTRWRSQCAAKSCAPCASISAEIRSAEHTSELQSLKRTSYAVFCLKKTNKETTRAYNVG